MATQHKAGTPDRFRVAGLDGGLQSGGRVPREDWTPDQEMGLAECRNVWWKDGALRTRPGVRVRMNTFAEADPFAGAIFAREETIERKGEIRPVRRFVRREGTAPEERLSISVLEKEGEVRKLPGSVGINQGGYNAGYPGNGLTFDYLAGPRAFGGTDFDGTLLLSGEGTIYAHGSGGSFTDLQSVLYAPLLLENGIGGSYGYPPKQTGTFFPESRNMLTGAFRATYTTDGESSAFYLPFKNLDNKEIRAVLESANGTRYTHVVAAGTVYGTPGEDGLTMHCSRVAGCVFFTYTEDGRAAAPSSSGTENNLTVIAYKTDPDLLARVYGMGFSVWYGGDRSPKKGGGRLFLAGNPDYPGLVCWSAGGNPLYFPEENQAVVGDAGQAVTAFGRVADRLVIFKERELYGLSYVADTTSSAGFPAILLDAKVGCTEPETIRKVGQRLVWAFDGQIYGIESDRKVRCLSEGIRGYLQQLPPVDWKQASAGEYSGAYLLLLREGRMLVLDGENSPRWHLWEVDPAYTRILSIGDRPLLVGKWGGWTRQVSVIASLDGEKDTTLFLYDEEGTDIQVLEKEIPASFLTARFHMGEPFRTKRIHEFLLETQGSPQGIKAALVTERGEGRVPLEKIADGVRRLPGVDLVRGCGLSLEWEGPFALRSLEAVYSQM